MSQDLGLSQIIDVPTRGTSFLDLLFSNKPDLVRNCKLLAGLGDHEAVKVQLALHPIRKKPTKRRIHLWNKVDEAKLLQDAHTFKTKFLELFFNSECRRHVGLHQKRNSYHHRQKCSN